MTKIAVIQNQGVENLVFQNFSFEVPSTSIKIFSDQLS